MRRAVALSGVVFVGALAIVLATLASGAVHRGARCAASGSRTVKATRTTRIYSRVIYVKQLHQRATALYGCLYRRDQSYRLPGLLNDCPNDFDPDLKLVRIGGQFIGYPAEGCTPSADFAFAFVIDVRNGKRLRATKATWEPPGPATGFPPASSIRAFVMRSTGSVAWIVERIGDQYNGTPTIYEVRKAEGPGTACRIKAPSCPPNSPDNFRLDSGARIAPTSLRLIGRTLFWRNNGVTKTATLN